MGPSQDDARQALQQEMDGILGNIDAAFKGAHAEALTELTGLSQDDLDAITPSLSSQSAYLALVDVVKNASARNLSNAELKSRIVALGTTAVAIARKVQGLATLFA